MGEPYLTSKLQGFGTTIFAEMSALAVATGAINLGQGFPDTDGPDEVRRGRRRRHRARATTSTRPGRASPSCARAIAAHQRRFYGLDLDPDTEVLVTGGATEAIAAALLALCDPGDEVIAFEPYYDSYAACIAMAGAHRRPVTLRPPDFALDPDDAARRGHAAHPADPAQLAAQPDRQGVRPRRARRRSPPWRSEHDLLVVTDEVYEHLIFDDAGTSRSHAAGHARAHGHDRLGRQDVLLHRLEGRLGVRAGPARRRRAHGQAVPHLRGQRPVPARGGGRPALPDAVLRRVRRRPAAQARPAVRRAGAGRPRGLPPAGHVLRHRRHPLAGRGRRPGVLPGPARALRRGRRPQRRVLRRRGRRPPARCASRSASAAGARRGRRLGLAGLWTAEQRRSRHEGRRDPARHRLGGQRGDAAATSSRWSPARSRPAPASSC